MPDLEIEDACPHCSPNHERPESRPWGVSVSPARDGDGQPTHLVVQPSNGAHVAQSDADWLWQLIRDYRPDRESDIELAADVLAAAGWHPPLVEPRVFFPGDTVPADLPVANAGGTVIRREKPSQLLHGALVAGLPSFGDQWQAVVDRARTEREAQA